MREQTLGAVQGLGGWQAGTLGSVSIATSSRRTGFPWGRGCCWLEHEALRFPPLPLFMGNNITPDPHGTSPCQVGHSGCSHTASSCRGTDVQIRGLVQVTPALHAQTRAVRGGLGRRAEIGSSDSGVRRALLGLESLHGAMVKWFSLLKLLSYLHRGACRAM